MSATEHQELLEAMREELEKIRQLPEDKRPLVVTIPGTNKAFFNPL
jgi:hypothetical protein